MGAIAILAGSALLITIPLGWLWLIPHLHQPSALFYLLVLIGCPATMASWGIALYAINRRFIGFSLERHRRNEVLEAGITVMVLVCLLVLMTRAD